MQCPRSYRFVLLLCFVICISIYNYRSNAIRIQLNFYFQTNILSKNIDQRLSDLKEHFKHVNISMLLYRPVSDQSPSITYRCREWCGGWGDRLRGITSTFILAVLTRRRFYIDMPYPCELSRLLKPNFYDWKPIKFNSSRTELHLETKQNSLIANKIYNEISSTNFIEQWSKYDDIYLTTNSDYITPALANPHLTEIVRLLNFSSNESTQTRLFPLIYEFLFRPTEQIEYLVNQVLNYRKSIICVHIRLGRNPTMIFDEKLAYREQIIDDMLTFLNQNLTNTNNTLLFLTSDSMEVNQYISQIFSKFPTVTIPGRIIHIDRLSSNSSSDSRCQDFAKVLSDFYVLGECDQLIIARSGFSYWASQRRYFTKLFQHLYLYCRGLHQITDEKWKRPHAIC